MPATKFRPPLSPGRAVKELWLVQKIIIAQRGLAVFYASRQIREIGDPRHSASAERALAFKGQKTILPLGVEAKMQKVSSVLAYVVNEGRVCALKPSEWSILLAGVALCGFVTLLVLVARV